MEFRREIRYRRSCQRWSRTILKATRGRERRPWDAAGETGTEAECGPDRSQYAEANEDGEPPRSSQTTDSLLAAGPSDRAGPGGLAEAKNRSALGATTVDPSDGFVVLQNAKLERAQFLFKKIMTSLTRLCWLILCNDPRHSLSDH